MEPPSSNSIAVLNQSGRRLRTGRLKDAVAKTLELHSRSNSSLELLLTDSASVRDLNARFRSVDEETDVLTFPAPEGTPYLGEVAIAVPYAEAQARARGVSLDTELGYLAIHGTLHLLGFDDETEADHHRMLEEMNRAGTAAGLPPDPEWWSILHGGAA